MVLRVMLATLAVLLAEGLGQEHKFSTYVSPTSGPPTISSPQYPGLYPPSSTNYTVLNHRLNMDCKDVKMGHVPWECSDSLTVDMSVRDDGTALCSPFSAESVDRQEMSIQSTTERFREGRFTSPIRDKRNAMCDCGWTPEHIQKKRIVGSQDAGMHEFPFMVSIVNGWTRSHAFGGSIISPYYVLTAAHALKVLDFEWTAILVGEHKMGSGVETNATRLIPAAQFIFHPDYDERTQWNDIGLIRSSTMIEFNSKVGPICLPFKIPSMPKMNDPLIAMGWGTTSHGGPVPNVLQKVVIHVVPERDCQAVFNETASSGKQVCIFTPGKDTCQMDSGGPLVYFDGNSNLKFLAALVSFGRGCDGDYPAVNTRIFPYLDWIRQETNELFCTKYIET